MLVGVGNDRHPKPVVARVADREAHAVDGHRSLLDRAVVALRLVAEGEIPAPLGILDRRADGRLIHMPLHDVAVEQRVGPHRPFDIDQIAHLQRPQIAAQQRLLHGGHRIGIFRQIDHRQTHAVVSDALVDLQLAAESRTQGEMLVLLFVADGHHGRRLLYDP